MDEPSLPPLAPAFANALAQLTGKPLRQLPFQLS
jgi:isoquinoline 1-oxidoreductase beta subunit